MKVGVYLHNIKPKDGGGFTISDDIFQSLVKLESQHTFVVFSNLTEAQTGAIPVRHIKFVPIKRGFIERLRYKLARLAAKVIGIIPLAQNWFQIPHTNLLQKAIDDLNIDVMWFTAPSHYIEIDVPYIFTVWDLQHRLQPWFPEVSASGEWDYREKRYAAAIPRSFAVIVGAEAGKEEIVHFYRIPPERVKLIPHPTPNFALHAPKDSNSDVLTKYQIPEGYLFYPAQFWPHKNHVVLLLAVNLLRELYELIFPVVFVGSDKGNLQHIQKMLDKLGIFKQVHFLGFVPQEDLVELYRHAFALTYPTFFGPENLPPLEAFALGCPVIASNVSGAQEQLGNAALLVDPKDEKEIALAVKSLYDDPILRQTLVQRGLKRAAQWTSDDFVKEVFSILDDFEAIRRCWK